MGVIVLTSITRKSRAEKVTEVTTIYSEQGGFMARSHDPEQALLGALFILGAPEMSTPEKMLGALGLDMEKTATGYTLKKREAPNAAMVPMP